MMEPDAKRVRTALRLCAKIISPFVWHCTISHVMNGLTLRPHEEKTMTDAPSPVTPIIIKKYANRRLYNTETSSYITLDHLSLMVKENREFKVVDAKSGDDITRQVLTQIIVEEESRGQTILPVSFLRQLISMYGDSLQAMVPSYLDASMDAFRRNQEQFRKALQGTFTGTAFGPFEQLAKQNMAMFEAATEMFTGRKDGVTEQTPATLKEINELKAQMEALRAKMEKLG